MKSLEMTLKENENLIYKVASKFYNFSKEDLFQQGALGLTKAYNRYKENDKCKFSSYAYNDIFGEMYDCVNKNREIKVSKETLNLYKKLISTKEILAQKLNRYPTNYDLAMFLEVDVNIINETMLACEKTLSLDNDCNDINLQNLIPSKEEDLLEKIFVQDAVDTLEEPAKSIIKMRYFEDKTQSEIANELNLTQVMVSRLEQKSLKKMRTYMDC